MICIIKNLIIFTLYISSYSFPQDNFIFNPSSVKFKTTSMPYVDNNQLKIDNNKDANSPFKYAEKIATNINTVDYGEWQFYNEKFKVWRLNIVSKNAVGMKLVFNNFFLPENSKLYIYNESKDMMLGPIDENANHPDLTFGHQLLKGDSIYIELFIPHLQSKLLQFQISNVIHAFEDILGFNSYDNQRDTCGINVFCPEADPYINQINSAVYLVMDQYICSGSIVNNARQDLSPYFLTAYHCVEEETNINSHNYFTFYFRYQSLSCHNEHANYSYNITGSKTIAWSNLESSDFALLKLDNDLPNYFNTYYSGWSRSTQNQTVSVGIHHPSGKPKKINFDNNDAPSSCGWFNSMDNTHWCLNWDEGGTEGGSSGSPLFNSDNQIIGQLSGGNNECGGTNLYGKFSHSWDGLDSSNRLKDWLDPDNTNIMSLNGTSNGILDFDGDINQDFLINILDIITLISIILDQYDPSIFEIGLSDINNDNHINVGDIVLLIEIIIN